MSNIAPLFTSAPRLKIIIENQIIAYAIGFDISVTVNVTPVKTIGFFGPMSLEPTQYNVVTGTLQIVKLRSAASVNRNVQLASNPFIGSSIQSQFNDNNGGEVLSTQEAEIKTNSIANVAGLHAHLDPSKVLASVSFNLDVYFRLPGVQTAKQLGASGVSVFTTYSKELESNWLRIQNCRITGRNTNIALGALVNEPVNFMGTLLTPMNGSSTVFGHDIGRSTVNTF